MNGLIGLVNLLILCMNQLTSKISDILKPFVAIIAYKAENSDEYYIEQRKIVKGKMSAGSPLKEKTIGEIMEAIAVNSEEIEDGIRGLIPQNLLYCDTRIGNSYLVWYRPPQKRSVCFSPQTGIKDGEMWVPGLLYVVRGKSLAVYSFKGNKPKCKLYRAPFMNVDENHVCLGNANLKKPSKLTFENIIAYWEGMFWQSEFSHILGENPINGNLATVTKKCIRTGCKFPTDILKPIKKTLNDFLK